jgi:anti-sigma factor RsiW
MECNKYVDEKIGESDSPAFRAHLAGCAECARDVEELREVRALYRSASTEKYRGGVPRLRRFRLGWVPMAAAAAILMMVFGLILGGPGEHPTKKSDPVAGEAPFVRVRLAPWGGEARIQTALDDCWTTLERLENNR